MRRPSVEPTEPKSPTKPAVVRVITEADYQLWKHHPVTKWFRQYLNDFRGYAIAETNAEWLNGDLKLDTAEGNRAQIKMLQEMAELEFGDVADFYDGVDQQGINSDAE